MGASALADERLDPQSYVPLHMQLILLLRRAIESGTFAPDDRLPSERELSERYGVSRITAGAALQELVRSGLAYRRQGKGTFVARPRLSEMSLGASFTEAMRKRGLTPSSRLLACEVIPADGDTAERLGLAPEAPSFRLSRVRLADGDPVAIETAYISRDLCPGLEGESLEHNSLYEVFGRRYGLRPAWAEGVIEAVAADEQEALLLDLNPGDPVLSIWRVTYNESYVALEWVHSVYRADRFNFSTGRQPVQP